MSSYIMNLLSNPTSNTIYDLDIKLITNQTFI